MLEQENNDVVVDSSTTTDDSTDDSDSTVESKSVPYERFKDVNEELKRLKQERLEAVTKKDEPKVTPKSETSTFSEDDLFVIKQLEDKEEYEMAKEVAKLKNVSISEAVSSQMFKLWKQERTEEKRQEKVQMEASRGSGNRGKKKDFSTPGLSPQEHKELWLSKRGR